MRTRILPAIALLPLLAACVEAPDTPPAAEEAPAVEAAAVRAPEPAAAPPAQEEPASAEPTPASTVAAAPAVPPAPREVLGAPPPAEGEAPAAEEEDSAEAEEAPAAPAAAGRLGTTVASLGSPTEGGLWLETPLVEAATQGRIEYNGQTVTVQLRPSGGEPGSGSQISVEAMRALGAPLTSLPELVVFAG